MQLTFQQLMLSNLNICSAYIQNEPSTFLYVDQYYFGGDWQRVCDPILSHQKNCTGPTSVFQRYNNMCAINYVVHGYFLM